MTAQAMMERFDLPEELAVRLPILASLLNGRDQVLAGGFSYERLLLEMSRAIAASGVQSPEAGTESSGQYWIHPEAIINEDVTIEGPCIVCRGAEVGPHAFLGAGTVVGPFAKLGYGVVIKATIIGARSKIKYRTSIANSIIGEAADISETVAVATGPNRRSPIRSWTASGESLETELDELGSRIGNQTKIGEGSLILPGSVICDDVKVRNSTINGYINSLDAVPREDAHGEAQEDYPWPPSYFPDEQRKGPPVTPNKVLLTAVVVLALLMAGLLGLAFFSMNRVDSVVEPVPAAAEPAAGETPTPVSPPAVEVVPASPGAPVSVSGSAPPPSPETDLALPPPAVPTPLAPPGFTLQVGSFRTRARAEVLEERLRARDLSPYVVEADVPGTGRYYRVRVGRFPTSAEAGRAAAEIQERMGSELGVRPWVVPYGPAPEP